MDVSNVSLVGVNLTTVLTLLLSTVVFMHPTPFVADPFDHIPGLFSDLRLGGMLAMDIA